MRTLGLTGGIGMGKSTAARFLAELGASVVDTDVIARDVVKPGSEALKEIVRNFGPHALDSTGNMDRKKMGALVFSDPAARQVLEGILHPRIRERWLAQLKTWRAEKKLLAVLVIPLLYETAAEKQFDAVASVFCSATSQMNRLSSRGLSESAARQRIESQLPIEKKVALSDYAIWTEGSLDLHRSQWERTLAHFSAGRGR